eukprot:COSAG02_NODE_405_length_23022_cov_14.617764_11_plen_114_part_00
MCASRLGANARLLDRHADLEELRGAAPVQDALVDALAVREIKVLEGGHHRAQRPPLVKSWQPGTGVVPRLAIGNGARIPPCLDDPPELFLTFLVPVAFESSDHGTGSNVYSAL